MADTVRIAKLPKKAKMGGKSKKGRRTAHNHQTGKYVRQKARTTKNKNRAWKRHLEEHPNDKQNIKDIQRCMKG